MRTLNGESLLQTNTGSTGTYQFTGLGSGKYLVSTSNGQGYIDKWYNDKPSQSTPPSGATPVDVSAGNATAINFTLPLGRKIAGKVTDGTGRPLNEDYVRLYDSTGEWVGEETTGPDGTYEFTGFLAGKYKVRTLANWLFVDEWYNNLPVKTTTFQQATPVDVTTTSTASINFALDRQLPPVVGNLTPTPAIVVTNQAQVFTATYSDGNGAANLKECRLLFSTASGTSNAVYIVYDENTNTLKLLKDDNTTWATGAPGGADWPENARVTLDLEQTSVTKSGNTLSFAATMFFKAAFVGTRKIYLSANDDQGLSAAWTEKGQVTIN